MSTEPFGKPDAWKLARPVWGWGQGETPWPTPRTFLARLLRNNDDFGHWRACCASEKNGVCASFSLPLSYFERYKLADWNDFLADFVEHWPTDQDHATVQQLRRGNPRTGTRDEFRITERWTSSAKSNFQFGVPGQVACSTHAGIPWMHRIRSEVGKKVHFWPFDGSEPRKGKSVIVERSISGTDPNP